VRAFVPLPERSRRRLGLGDFGPGDLANPDFTAGWAQVQAQLTPELPTLDPNAAGDLLQAAQQSYQDSFHQILGDPNLSTSLAGQIGDISAKFTLVQHTVAGAVNTVQGLINTAKGLNPVQVAVQVASQFSGPLLAEAAAAGIMSAGVGAAVVALSGVVLPLLVQMFSQPPTGGVQIQPGCFATPGWSNDFSVGYLMFQADVPAKSATDGGTARISPTDAAHWRSFPLANDPVWFAVPVHAGGQVPRFFGGYFSHCYWDGSAPGPDPTANWRWVDLAFPDYRYLECEQSMFTSDPKWAPLVDFQRAFFAAWKANQEYALNGLQPLPNAAVLLRTLRLWNLSHDNSTTIPITSSGSTVPALEGPCPAPWGQLNIVPYINYFVEAALVHAENTLMNADHSQLVLNAGPRKAGLPVPGGFLVNIAAAGAIGAGASAPMSTTGKIAVGTALVGGATAAGIAVYASRHGLSFGAAAKRLWGKLF
jgi:hypothetical protein